MTASCSLSCTQRRVTSRRDSTTATYPTRLPIDDISAALKAAGIPVNPSDNAGDYLCNLTFYRLIERAERGGPQIVGFVHVPYLDTQVARLTAEGHNVPHASTLTEAQLIAAVMIASDLLDAIRFERLREFFNGHGGRERWPHFAHRVERSSPS